MPSAKPSAVAVLQTGTYNSWNKGDAAMQLVAERFFTANAVEVVVSTPFPQHDRQLYSRVCRSRRRNRIGGPALLGLSVLARAFGRLGRRLFLPDEEGRLMAEANLVVDLSGDMLTEDSGIAAAVSHLIPIARAWVLGTPYATAPQSIGPFRVARPAARFLLRRAQLVIARETITYRYLIDDLGIEPDRVMQAADLAFLLEPVGDAVPSVEARSSSPRVGVSLSGLITERAARADIDIVAAVARTIDRLVAEHGLSPIIFGQVTGPDRDKDDRIVARRVSEAMVHTALVLDADLTPGELKGAIGTCDYFIGARMHANIAALSQGVPTVAIAYSHKTQGIMESLGQGDLVVRLDKHFESGGLDAAVDLMIASGPERREELVSSVEKSRNLATTALARLLNLARTGTHP